MGQKVVGYQGEDGHVSSGHESNDDLQELDLSVSA